MGFVSSSGPMGYGRKSLKSSIKRSTVRLAPSRSVSTNRRRPKEKLPVFLWFHGGGFILGDLFVGDGTCRTIANRSGAIVVAVDYRKAPEFDLYTGRKDCLAAVSWIAEHGHEIGVDPSRIAVGGDSAGGNLAAVVAQQCVRHGGPKLSLQVLAYPATHLGTDYRAMMDLPDGYLLTTESVDWFRRHLGKFDVNDPLLSPLLADDLKGLCPALMITRPVTTRSVPKGLRTPKSWPKRVSSRKPFIIRAKSMAF